MSRLRVKAIVDTTPHLMEVDRRAITLSQLNAEIGTKTKLSGFSLHFQNPETQVTYQLNDDETLHRAIAEATKAGCRSLDVKVHTGGSHAPSTPTKPAVQPTPTPVSPPPQAQPTQQPQQPQAQPSPSHHTSAPSNGTGSSHTAAVSTPPKHFNQPSTTPTKVPLAAGPTPAQQPLNPGDILITEFTVAHDPSSNQEKVKIESDQTYAYFLFKPKASKHDTQIRVILAEKIKLQYQCVYSFEDQQQRSIRTVQLTQSFQLPFEATPNLIEVNGQEIKVMIPNRF
eukprot:TRINITY_DN9405_c0_g1_i1.p1 TRINITY_DN9405_c0_g1~~TRINITY_DN9405_c0_g1_i1.p1  ORF type:complete len:293 (-),score=67.92 TRINITY_DN9405_c0_g1_i1:28-879(-)